ncbi:hypothetical protein U1Q18_017641, partial [Sarracenia purpurea var. burkii]
YQSMTFTSLKGEFLLVHGLRIKLRERVRGAAKRGVHRPIDLVEARRHRFPLLPHPECSRILSFSSPPIRFPSNHAFLNKYNTDFLAGNRSARFRRDSCRWLA